MVYPIKATNVPKKSEVLGQHLAKKTFNASTNQVCSDIQSDIERADPLIVELSYKIDDNEPSCGSLEKWHHHSYVYLQ